MRSDTELVNFVIWEKQLPNLVHRTVVNVSSVCIILFCFVLYQNEFVTLTFSGVRMLMTFIIFQVKKKKKGIRCQ